jgi:CheY-like chemotaxis protein
MSKTNFNCLLIDDDKDDQDIFLMALAKTALPVSCQCANDGEEGLQVLRRASTKPDFVFLDLNMPNMDGKACLQIIRQETDLKFLPVIIYSTSSYIDDIRETRRLGATGFITKPSNINVLADILRQVMEGTYVFANGEYYQ